MECNRIYDGLVGSGNNIKTQIDLERILDIHFPDEWLDVEKDRSLKSAVFREMATRAKQRAKQPQPVKEGRRAEEGRRTEGQPAARRQGQREPQKRMQQPRLPVSSIKEQQEFLEQLRRDPEQLPTYMGYLTLSKTH